MGIWLRCMKALGANAVTGLGDFMTANMSFLVDECTAVPLLF